MRRIFSTVLGPQEPALTVGSLAIRATRRPSIRPRPVRTPSAPRPSCSQLASSASSTKESGSKSLATRSRTASLPCSAVFWWWRSGPPERAASTAWVNSVIGASLVIAAGTPLDGAGPEHVGAERSAQGLFSSAGGLDQTAKIDPGRDPHLVQHRDHVLARDVPGRARRHRAAAQLA